MTPKIEVKPRFLGVFGLRGSSKIRAGFFGSSLERGLISPSWSSGEKWPKMGLFGHFGQMALLRVVFPKTTRSKAILAKNGPNLAKNGRPRRGSRRFRRSKIVKVRFFWTSGTCVPGRVLFDRGKRQSALSANSGFVARISGGKSSFRRALARVKISDFDSGGRKIWPFRLEFGFGKGRNFPGFRAEALVTFSDPRKSADFRGSENGLVKWLGGLPSGNFWREEARLWVFFQVRDLGLDRD